MTLRHVILARLGLGFGIIGDPPDGISGQPYSFTFSSFGGLAPIVWRCTPNPIGSSGISLSSATLSSGSAVGGTYTFTIEAFDSNRQRASATFTIVITGVGPAPGDRLVTEAGNPMITEAGNPMIPE